jgi:membrane protease YdiL (CAAX protease family)
MLDIPSWDPAFTDAALILSLFLLGYSAYFFFAEGVFRRPQLQEPQSGENLHPLRSRYVGGLVIGVLPALIMVWGLDKGWATYGVRAHFDVSSLSWVLILGAILVPLNYFNSRKTKHLASYPTVRRSTWTRSQVANYAFSWVCYLFGYELMFRGLLLFGLIPVFGVWPSILLNVVLYVLVHLPKSIEESIGALPLGLLLCLITLQVGTIWVAVLVHITLALSNFFFSLRHHPDMKVSL